MQCNIKQHTMNFNDNIDALNTIRFVNGTNRSIFLTGKAGTGKTTLLRNIVQHTHKNTIIVAPTGIAALNAGGVTIHSMFQVPFGAFTPEQSIHLQNISFQLHTLPQLKKEAAKLATSKRTLLKQLELLIIDEVSMLRADLLDAIDTVLRFIRRKKLEPFGGVQVLFIGDMLQLPPIVKEDEWNYLRNFYKSLYFFDALVFNQQKPIVIELGKIYRQSDAHFVRILNNLRNNIITPEDIATLNTYYKPDYKKPKNQSTIFITTHNRKADAINFEELKKLPSKTHTYTATIHNDFPEHMYPLDFSLEIKEGSQIMFIKNDYSGEANYYNGKIGNIHELTDDSISVIFPETQQIVTVEKYTWENKKFKVNPVDGTIEEEVIGTFVHYPIKLAWAVTVHKSQGLTFKHAIIDVSEAFAPGQIYVALSRLESLDGLVLTQQIQTNIPEQDTRLLQFTNKHHSQSDLEKEYKNSAELYLHKSILQTFDFNPLLDEINAHIYTYDKEENRSNKQQFLGEVQNIKKQILPIVEIGDKFIHQLSQLISENQPITIIEERVNAAAGYFEPLLQTISDSFFTLISEVSELRGVKQYITELRNIELQYFNAIQKIYKCKLLCKAIQTNETVSKQALQKSIPTERSKAVSTIQQTKSKKKLKTITQKETHTRKKELKKDTKEITFELYSQQYSIDEIAHERNLSITTIESHIAYFVAEGMIQISELIDSKTVKQIQNAVKKSESKSLKTIKETLPNDIPYSSIKLVMAHMEFTHQL